MFANLSQQLWLHFVAVSTALVIGLALLLSVKGTQNHRRAGWLYVAAMVLSNAGALTSYRLGLNLFHFFAIVSFVSLFLGLRAIRRWRVTRDPQWLRSHRINMGFSYLGLVMAGVSQFATNPRFGLASNMEPMQFWGLFAVINLVLYTAGSWLVFRNAGAVTVR